MTGMSGPAAKDPPRDEFMKKTVLLLTITASLVAPAFAHAGTAVSTVPNLPSGSRAGGAVTVSEGGIPGHVVITQTFNGADFGAIGRLRLIRLSLNCGPGPSPGNPGTNGPAINTPEIPCTNPDLGVFGGLSATGTGSQACTGISFALTAPDSQGQIDMTPSANVDLGNGFTCEINFTFSVLKVPTRDTFPNASGMQTTSVSSVRSEIVSDLLNPGAVGLQAAGLGSGDAVLVEPPPPTCESANPPSSCTTTTPNCTSANPPSSCGGALSKKASAPKLHTDGTCAKNKVRASVTGSGIKKVTFLIDGHVVKTVKGKSPYKLKTSVHNLSAGSHRVTAKVTYKASPTQVMTKRFSRCRDPNFTG